MLTMQSDVTMILYLRGQLESGITSRPGKPDIQEPG